MSKLTAFVVLLLIAGVFLALGYRFEANFLSDLWSQLFMLTVGTLSTTIVLEAVLKHGADRRDRAKDAFALRSFSATMLSDLLEIVGVQGGDQELLEAAVAGKSQFAAAAAKVASHIENSTALAPDAYLAHYIDIENNLRTLSRQYIRLFSANRQDMVTQFRDLNQLAAAWRYMSRLSKNDRNNIEKMPQDDPYKQSAEKELSEQKTSALTAAANTAKMLSLLVAKNADGKVFYD
jgi:hypothetical protein